MPISAPIPAVGSGFIPYNETPYIPYSETSLVKGIKSINNNLIHEQLYTTSKIDGWNVDGEPLLPILPFHLDYIDLDIHGIKYDKKDSKINSNPYPIDEKIILDDFSSRMMIRTNPLLSGNIKLTVDSAGSIWLNSIDANDELSDSRFKKFKLDPKSTYASDVYRFLDNGKVKSEILFDLKQYDSTYQSSKREYHLQYDNFYGCGAQQLSSKLYDEEFSFFAPLWVKKDVPEFFVVFKVPHSLNTTSYSDYSDSNILKEMLENAEIIKTFDLRAGSKIGKYIRNIVNGARFKERPLSVSFDKDSQTTWSGIIYHQLIDSNFVLFLMTIERNFKMSFSRIIEVII